MIALSTELPTDHRNSFTIDYIEIAPTSRVCDS
ncbi:hypothetical protein HOV93_07500 [Planctomycetes bacterium FF15]|uniref:Uncharacterized protein n=1 Tax=Bremerella alba TaxID=980252 RepID=A0A7V9A657_9BACT|nr:hypothetical protein [Bremerella alba]